MMHRAAVHVLLITLGVVLASGAFAPAAPGADMPPQPAGDPGLSALIAEALSRNPRILALQHRIAAAGHRVKPARTLPDPMFMTGYQNEGIKRYSYGQSFDAQWMFSVSQMFPFAGKRGLKGEMAERERQGLEAELGALHHQIGASISEVYFDLFLGHKTLALLDENAALFKRMEAAALARYAAGMGKAAEVAMAQAEKYMITERRAMARQKIASLEAMLASLLGRTAPAAVVPQPPSMAAGHFNTEALIEQALDHSPRLAAGRQMIEAARVRIRITEKEFFPDLTVAANWFNNGGAFEDMWSVTTTVNLPLFYKDKQREQVREANALLQQAQAELETEKNMIVAEIRDSGAMVEAARSLMALYEQAIIPQNRQEVALLMADYAAGQGEAAMVIGRSRALVESEINYWTQAAGVAKAMARVDALVGTALPPQPQQTHDHGQKESP